MNTEDYIFYFKYGFLYLLILLFAILMYYLTTNKLVYSKSYTYILLILLPIIVLLSFIIFLGRNADVSIKTFFLLIASVLVVVSMIYLYQYLITLKLSPFTTTVINTFFTIFIFMFFIVGLAIVYKTFEKYINNLKGIPGFIIQFIFFLPCLLTDFIEFIKYQFSITPSVVFILFVIEIFIIGLIYFIPSLLTKVINPIDSIPILQDACYLNKKTTWGSSSKLEPLQIDDSLGNITQKTRVNYSISMWVNIYNNNENLQSNIFSYGSDNIMKPQIIYLGPTINSQSNCRLIYSNTSIDNKTPYYYDFSINDQRWNYIVITYNNTSVDLFINGILVVSKNLGNNIPMFYPTDSVIIGDETMINGAISNVCYYKTPLSQYQIVNTYNLLKNKSPPINYIL